LGVAPVARWGGVDNTADTEDTKFKLS